LASADQNSIAQLLKEIKTLNIPVKGVISDGQRSIRLAIAQEFPNVPHQLCHFHYLRNIARPISEMDRALKVDLKKKARHIKPIERKSALESSRKSTIILQYCQTIRYALQEDADYPLKPGGLKLYRRLRKIRQSIHRSNKLWPNNDLEKLLNVLSTLEEMKPQYRRVNRLYKLIFRANRILNQDASAEKVETAMFVYFDDLMELFAHSKMRVERAAVENILRYTAGYWAGLFHSYDCKDIPRTNNELEVYNRSLKTSYRKTTGRSSCQEYIIHYGAYVCLLDSFASKKDILFGLRLVGCGAFRRCFTEIRRFRGRLSLKRVLSEDLNGFLCGLEFGWAKIMVWPREKCLMGRFLGLMLNG
jgi:hypothetical protein